MSRSFSTAKVFYNVFTSPAFLVSLLGPVIVEVAQMVIMGDIFENHSSNPSKFAIALTDSASQCVTLYSIQVYTVVLAVVLWMLSLMKKEYLTAVVNSFGAEDDSTPEHKVVASKVMWYFIAACVIIIAAVFLFKHAASEQILTMYDPMLAIEPQVSWNPISWVQWVWWKVNGPPTASPLSWIRLLIVFHSAALNFFGKWCKSLLNEVARV